MMKATANRRIGHRKLDRMAGWELYLLILPPLIFTLIFSYGPMYGVIIAFKNYRTSMGILASPWAKNNGLQHFIRFLNYPGFKEMIMNTLSITLYSLILFPLPIILALMLNEVNNQKFKKTVQMISYAPHFLSTVVMCGIVTIFLNRSTGLFNAIRVLFGMERFDFLAKPSLFADIYVWSGQWQGLGWGTILYVAALSSVSPELIEAARIDGATRVQIIRHVNLPSIMPTIVITFIMSMGGLLSVGFEKIFLLQNDLNLPASRVIATYTYEVGITGGQFSYSAAIGLFNNIVNVIFITTANAIVKKLSGTGIY